MSIQILPNNLDDVLKIFGFLKEYTIPFHIPDTSVAALKELLVNHDLTIYKTTLAGTLLEDLCEPKEFDEILLCPTPTLKHFCGAEWIINRSYVTEKIISQRIEQYALINKLRNGVYTKLDETLQHILGTDKIVVNDYELRELFKNTYTTCNS